jgi:hypothetical protein
MHVMNVHDGIVLRVACALIASQRVIDMPSIVMHMCFEPRHVKCTYLNGVLCVCTYVTSRDISSIRMSSDCLAARE